MSKVKLIWSTPDGENLVAYMARVSNPENQDNKATAPKLLKYLLDNKHFSPFEMVNICVEIETTRDIARQILRHRSFSFQELCIAGGSLITLELPSGVKNGKRAAYKRTIEHLYNLQSKGKMPAFARVFDEESSTFVCRGIKEVFQTGVKPLFKITLANGKTITSTKEHKFLTEEGFKTLEDAIGLRMIGSTAAMSKEVAFGCNGVAAHTDRSWLSSVKEESIAAGKGLSYIAEKANVTTHTIRKWLQKFDLQYTKKEVASYTPIWNKGLFGYSLPKHSAEAIEKMKASARRGASSNLWRGGAARSERLKIADWCAANRSEFFRNANYQCNRCSSTVNLEMHHKETVASRPDLAYEKSNIEVLCKKCHREHHNISEEDKTWRANSKGRTLTVHWSKVVSVEYVGEQMTYDMEIDHPSHNYVANGIVTHNSQRYAAVHDYDFSEARLQDHKNRQNSIEVQDRELQRFWVEAQQSVIRTSLSAYEAALANGIAKEQARKVLPEGMMMSRMYMNGTLRSWLHYIAVRTDPSTQKEHRDVAEQIKTVVKSLYPSLFKE